MKQQFGEQSEIFACGFSLGSNHLLRHLGTHEDCRQKCGIRAAMSISGAFDVLSVGIDLKYETLGIYDNYILKKIREPFLQKRFKIQTDANNFFLDEINNAKGLFNFD